MLAKWWKKALLFVCIVACLYNVIYKFVSRTSLETQLKKIQDSGSIIDVNENKKVDNTVNNKNQNVSNSINNNVNNREKKGDENIVVLIN